MGRCLGHTSGSGSFALSTSYPRMPTSDRDGRGIVCRILTETPGRLSMLRAVAALALPDAWLAAGAVRNAVWDVMHQIDRPTSLNDADVIWFDPGRADPRQDRALEETLTRDHPTVTWSVKNQARMHVRHGHQPYVNCLDAMRAWPETATAVAARLCPDGTIELAAPYGLTDLMSLRLRPGPVCPPDVFRHRVQSKGWLRRWPRLTVTCSGQPGVPP